MSRLEHDDAAATGDNLSTFTESLAVIVAQKLGTGKSAAGSASKKRHRRGRKNEIKPVMVAEDRAEEDAAELGDFIEYLANETFAALPPELRSLSYGAVQNNPDLAAKYETPLEATVVGELVRPLPLSLADSLCSYGVIEAAADVDRFMAPVLSAFVAAATTPPPEYTPALGTSRAEGCEICEREHLPLTYHHLIPRQVHSKVVKRGWHSAWELNKVAWLCRACHSYVHKIASNDELARELYSVDLLLERDDVQKWAAWIRRVRWKAR